MHTFELLSLVSMVTEQQVNGYSCLIFFLLGYSVGVGGVDAVNDCCAKYAPWCFFTDKYCFFFWDKLALTNERPLDT